MCRQKLLKINKKQRKTYPDSYPTLTKEFEILFITKQVLIENFFTKFLFQSVYKRNARLLYFKAHICIFYICRGAYGGQSRDKKREVFI